MKPVVRKYAAITARGFSRGPTVEITDEQDAVAKTRKHGICFLTFERECTVVNGKELLGEPQNYSERRYVGLDRLYTRDEVIADLNADTRFSRKITEEVIEVFQEYPQDSKFITGLERPGEFIRIKDGEKVFNREGRQLWPELPPPAAPKPLRADPKYKI